MFSNVSLASLPTSAARARLDWSAHVGTNPSEPIIAGDEIYVGTQSVDRRSEIHRFSAETGQKLSSAHTWPGVLEGQLGPTAVMRCPDGQVMGVNARSGEPQWSFQPSSHPAAIESDGETVVVATRDTLTGVYEPAEESPMDIAFRTDLSKAQSLAPGHDGEWLVHTGQSMGQGRLNQLDSQGQVKWSVPVASGGPQHAPAVLPDGSVLSTNFDGYVSAHSGTDGHELWRFDTRQTYVNRPDIGPQGQVIVSTCVGQVSQLSPDGTPAWTVDTGDRVQRTFVHEDGTVFVQHPQSLEALDPATGKSLQTLSLQSGDLVQGPDGNLFSLGRAGILQRIVLE